MTLVSPEEERDFCAIERALGRRLLRQKVEGFDYTSKPTPTQRPAARRHRPAPRRPR
jgi:hypothetical protein